MIQLKSQSSALLLQYTQHIYIYQPAKANPRFKLYIKQLENLFKFGL